MEFNELNLHSDLSQGVTEAGYLTCMPVQEQVLTHAFGGQDLYVQSQTGTGKTAAFLIVIFQRLLTEPNLAGKKALIMAPTRELAVQIEEEAKVLAKYLPFKIGSFYGGVGYGDQQRLLKDNAQILVGTPGRVLDLNGSGWMNLMDLAFLVLDEADRMFDMGFYPDLRKLIRVVPPADRRQTMLFSATLNAWVKNLAWEYTKTPYEIEITPETVTVEEVEQYLYHVPSADKMKLLVGILGRENPESAIIFCNTKRYAEVVAKRLRINGYDCEFIMGDLPQSKRLRIIEDLKAGKIRFLVATDVAARGLDIEALAMVVNYDLPVESENYVHRIGRTARAGKTGKAITLASEQDVYELPDIEKYIGKKVPSEIAVKELYGEDKSEGMRIRTEFFSEHGDDRGRREDRGDRRDGRREKSGGGFGRGRDRGENRPGVSGDRRPRQTGAPGDRRREGGDLSRLSFEDRMAHYKQKYTDAGAERGPSKESPRYKGNNPSESKLQGSRLQGSKLPETGGARPGQDGGKRRRRPRGRNGQEASGLRTDGLRPDGIRMDSQRPDGRRPGTGGAAAKVPEAEKSTVQTPAPAQKKSLVGRILGIFGKKRE
ncbi:MAG: DEAD/DEAH box helicase [Treponema sp.]|nr:DEAD/DEAH box helicase [Treponema sp.]